MANQMIALQTRNPQLPDPSRATRQMANLMTLTRQQEAAQLQAQQAQQTMQYQTNEENRKAALQEPNLRKAGSEATAAEIKTALEFNAFVYTALKNADSPDQVVGFAQRIASQPQFKGDLFQGSLSDAIASMPTDPTQFDAWRKTTAAKTLTAAQQLENQFQKQTTGTEERIISMPKYGRGAATEVPGSRIQVAQGMQYIKGGDDATYVVPTKSGGSFGTPSAGAPGKGGVAAALQTNPGALKDGAFTKSQPGYTGASGGFATFKTPEDGIAAQENLLRNAYLNKGFNTVDKIINRYAPQGSENSAASVANYKKYVAGKAGVDLTAPLTAAQIPAVAKAMREFETGQTQGRGTTQGTTQGPTQVLPGPSPKPKAGELTPEAKLARDTAAQNLYDAIEAAQKKGHLTSEKQSYIANRAQETLRGRTYLPGGTAQKTSIDDIDTAATQLLRLFIQKGTSGTLNTKVEQDNFMRSVGGADASYETRLKTIRNFAKQNGIPLRATGAAKPKTGGANTGTPVPRKASGGFTVVKVED